MKRSLLLMLVALPALSGDFINLTFDQPNLSGSMEQLFPNGPYRGSTADLLPGWSVAANGIPLATMTYSPLLTTSARPVSLVENDFDDAAGVLGRYTLYLESGLNPAGSEIRLSQRGTIPADAAGLWLASGYVQVFCRWAEDWGG